MWRIALLGGFILTVLGAVYIPRFIENNYPSLKQDGKVDQKVTSVITRSSKPGSVTIKIFGLDNKYKELNYQFKYVVDGKDYQLDMVGQPFNLRGKDAFTFDVTVNGCTDVMCLESTRATKLWIGLSYTDLTGKVIMTGTP